MQDGDVSQEVLYPVRAAVRFLLLRPHGVSPVVSGAVYRAVALVAWQIQDRTEEEVRRAGER
jgi:hypothetical protein